MLKRGEVYHELGEHYLDRIDRERTSRRLIKRLQALGFDVAVQDQTVQERANSQKPLSDFCAYSQPGMVPWSRTSSQSSHTRT